MREFKSHTPKSVPARQGSGPRPADKPVDAARLDRAQAQVSEERKRREAAADGEIGGPEGPEPTRYGDWERKGICVDF